MLRVVSMLVVFVTALLPPDTIPPALAKMADTERAFAKRAADAGARDAFIEFFADESINFNPDPGPARQRLIKDPAAFPKDLLIKWEPRVGDIAASGDLGFLTGPSEFIQAGQPNRYGWYSSVWKKQANGEYRVILDVGAGQPGPTAFGAPFTRASAIAAYKGKDTKANAEQSLLEADRSFGQLLAAKGPADAFGMVLHPEGRVHRSTVPLMTTRAAAAAWFRGNIKAMTSSPGKAEVAASADFGYTWGTYTMETMKGDASKGYYVRVWTRAADGKWQLAFDVTQRSAN